VKHSRQSICVAQILLNTFSDSKVIRNVYRHQMFNKIKKKCPLFQPISNFALYVISNKIGPETPKKILTIACLETVRVEV